MKITATKKEILAWYKLPEPDGTNYTENDLASESQVSKLFSYCKLGEAIILAKGWEFLFNEYGLVGLLEIDAVSGYIQGENRGDLISGIIYQSLITGFHPLINEFGDYDESESLFLFDNGSKLKIDWKEIDALKTTIDLS